VLRTDDVKQIARSTVTDPTSTTEEKAAARKAINRISRQATITKGRPKRPKRRDYESDEAHNRALFEFRAVLDSIAIEKECGRVLDSRDSSPLQRHNARKKLESLNGPPPPDVQPDEKKDSKCNFPTREDFGFESGEDWPEFVASGKEAEFQAALDRWRQTAHPPSNPTIAAFLNALDDESVAVHAIPAPQNVAPKAPTEPPTYPALFCEQCRVPFKVCGCNAVACNLCLRPQSDCYPPCPNSKRR
jgi:hypothetical protein